MGEGQKVDPTFVIEPAQEGKKKGRWEKPSDVPFNYTDLGASIRVADNARFEKVKPWGIRATNADGTEVGMVDPEVYFTMCFSSDIDPKIILRRIRDEWRRQGGNRLEMKELDCFETETAVVAYYMHNAGSDRAIIAEATKLLTVARQLAEKKDNDFPYANLSVPMMVIRSQVPKIPGLDTMVYANWHWTDGNKRKAFHFECAQSEVKQLQTLIEVAKKMKIVEAFWGPEVKLRMS